MTNVSLVVTYTKVKVAPPAGAIEYEKSFPSMNAALDFCVKLTDLGGEALYIIQYVRGLEERVYEGDWLAKALARQRERMVCAN